MHKKSFFILFLLSLPTFVFFTRSNISFLLAELFEKHTQILLQLLGGELVRSGQRFNFLENIFIEISLFFYSRFLVI